jgi:murein L,D-transpeptidase YcbB/YkuD
VLESADAKGLSGTDYDAGEWASRVTELLQFGGHASEQDLARFDLRLTASLTRYIAHVGVGKANPRIFSSAEEIKEHRRELQRLLEQLTRVTHVDQLLSSIEPQFPGYRRTLAALRFYTAIAENDAGPLLPTPKKPLASGGTYGGLPQLVERLIRFGDLSPKAGWDCTGNQYEGALVDAVKRFQLRHGLEPNGVLGASTVCRAQYISLETC